MESVARMEKIGNGNTTEVKSIEIKYHMRNAAFGGRMILKFVLKVDLIYKDVGQDMDH